MGAWPESSFPINNVFQRAHVIGIHPGWVRPLRGLPVQKLAACNPHSMHQAQGRALEVHKGRCGQVMQVEHGPGPVQSILQGQARREMRLLMLPGRISRTFPSHFGVLNHSLGRCVQLRVFCFGGALGLFLLFLGGEMGCDLGG